MTNVTALRPMKPSPLVLTKAEIETALAPMLDLSRRMRASGAACEAWDNGLPEDSGDFVGDDSVIINDGDIALYDVIVNLVHPARAHGEEGPVDQLYDALWATMHDEIATRDRQKDAERRKQRAAQSAETRKANAQAKRKREHEKDRRIAELEGQLAKPRPVAVSHPDKPLFEPLKIVERDGVKRAVPADDDDTIA